MKRILLFFALFIAIPSFAQIEEEIMQSKVQKIAKGREYLLEKFLDRDYEKVNEIKDYLLSLEDEYYLALQPEELWYVLMWTNEFDELASLIRISDSSYFVTRNQYDFFSGREHTMIFPRWDNLETQLRNRSVEEKHLLEFALQEAVISQEDKDFLSVFMDWLLLRNYCRGVYYYSEDVNAAATQFLIDYPNSDYEWFVRHLIREQYVEKDWGIGFGISFCSGFSSGNMPTNGIGMGVSVDVFYKKFDLTIGASVLTLKTIVDQTYSYNGVSNLVYPKGSNCNWNLPYANLAYTVLDYKRIALSPFIGIGGLIEHYPQNDNKEYEYKELDNRHLLYKAGLNFDIKFNGLDADKDVIRIKYEFGLTEYNQGQVSAVHLISVGLSGIFRGEKRVY